MIFNANRPQPSKAQGKIAPGSKEPRWQGNSAIPHHSPSQKKKENKQ